MNQERVSIRYAKALLKLAIDENVLDLTFDDMRTLKKTCEKNKDLMLLLKSPIIKTDKKTKILTQIFEGLLSKTTLTFLQILTTKKREKIIVSVAKSFIRLYKEYNQIETVSVTTAVPIDDLTKKEIINKIKTKTGKKLEINEFVDKKILGGIIIKIGDQQLDSSVYSMISKLKQKFNKNLYIQDY